MNILDLKKMNIFFEWIFWILKKWIFWILKKNEYFVWMNILDFYKSNNFLNKYFGLSLPASKIVVAKVSNSSEIIQGSLVGPISVHFRESFTYRGASGGLQSHILALFWNLNNFPNFLWMNNSIEHSGLYWMNIFLNEYFGFCFELNFELNHFLARFNGKMNFQNVSPRAKHRLSFFMSFPTPSQTAFYIRSRRHNFLTTTTTTTNLHHHHHHYHYVLPPSIPALGQS